MASSPNGPHRACDQPELSRETQMAGRDLVRIRTLYLERRYRQCVRACDDLYDPDLHAVHDTFRLFHQAICYEALGLAAHNYSRNKILFFESARDKLGKALDTLPLPFTVNESGRSDPLQRSPDLEDVESSIDAVRDAAPRTHQAPDIRLAGRTRTLSDASTHYSTSSTASISETYTVPDFDQYSPHPDGLAVNKSIPRTITFPDIQEQEDKWNELEEGDNEEEDYPGATPRRHQQPSYQARLSAHLSSTHVLAPDLVPTPLFGRRKKAACIPCPTLISEATPSTYTDQEQQTNVAPRPLPRTPHVHGTHLSLLPARRTAVQTLISRFENTLPSPNTPSSCSTASPLPSNFTPDDDSLKTPATARFAAIASTFAPKPPFLTVKQATNKNNVFADYLSSHTLSRFNKYLSSFRTSLLTSMERVEALINQAHKIQDLHEEEKRRETHNGVQSNSNGLGGKRLASMWLLDNKSASLRSPPHVRNSTCKRTMSVMIDIAGTTAHLGTTQAGNGKPRFRDRLSSLGSQENKTKKGRRIADLRICGFDVRKERHGWKGARYYEELRRSVEVELRV